MTDREDYQGQDQGEETLDPQQEDSGQGENDEESSKILVRARPTQRRPYFGGRPVVCRTHHGDDHILTRDPEYVKYERLLAKAENEGRLDGQHKCLVCGMKYLTPDEAENCCKMGGL